VLCRQRLGLFPYERLVRFSGDSRYWRTYDAHAALIRCVRMGRAGRKAFRLTDERRQVLDVLQRYRYLTTSRIGELRYSRGDVSDRAVRRLLKDFHDHGYLSRQPFTRTLQVGARAPEFVYSLSRAGLGLAEACGFCEDEQRPARSTRNLEHDLAISDFHYALESSSRKAHHELFWLQHGVKRGVNPDALFALTNPAAARDVGTAYFFLEVEHSGEGSYEQGRSVLLRRLHHYAHYQGSDECRQDWEWFDEFRVVVLVRTEARRKRLLVRLARELPFSMFLVGVEEGGAEVSELLAAAAEGPPRPYGFFV
jgi:hypothetical protein